MLPKMTLIMSAVLFALGCAKESDANQSEAQTRLSLRLWGEYVLSAYEADLPIDQMESCSAALSMLRQNGIIENVDYAGLAHDGWGRQYRWSVNKTRKDIVIVILSDGKDGVSQGGAGDDLFVEITKESTERGKATWRLKGMGE
jgi:hypothetical protein